MFWFPFGAEVFGHHNKHLPERMRLSRGTYYLTRYVDGMQKWIRLGKDYASACGTLLG